MTKPGTLELTSVECRNKVAPEVQKRLEEDPANPLLPAVALGVAAEHINEVTSGCIYKDQPCLATTKQRLECIVCNCMYLALVRVDAIVKAQNTEIDKLMENLEKGAVGKD